MDSQAGLERHASGCLLPPGYGPLLDRCTDVFEGDRRVRAAWVHGSVARGDADAASDLDVIVAVADDELAGFAAGWRDRLAAITPTVMARASFGGTGSWLSVTPTCQRFDLWVEPVSRTASSPVADRSVLFDRDGLSALVPEPAPPAPRSDAALARLRDRVAAALAVAGAADELLMVQVVFTLRWLLYDAYVEVNRPLPTVGLKQWSAKLTGAQRERFAALPTGGDPAPIVDALTEVLGERARPVGEPALGAALLVPEGAVRGLHLSSVPAGRWARHVAEEYLALHLYLGVAVHRRDWLLGVVGANDAHRLLYELFMEQNGRGPARVPDDWSGRLTAAQRAVLLDLPTGRADRDGVVEAHLAGREAFVRQGRAQLGAEWPAQMEEAVCDHVDRAVAAST